MAMLKERDIYSFNNNLKKNGTIVIVPSAFLNSEPLRGLAKALSGLFDKQIIFADVPGHCEENGESENTVSKYAEKIKMSLRDMQSEEIISKDNLHLVGWSLGGSIVLQIGLDEFPGIKKLTLLTSSSNWDFPDIPKDTFYDTFTKVAEAEMSEKYKAQLMEALGSMLAPLDTCMDDIRALQSFDVSDQLSRLKIPVLILGGGMDKISPLNDQQVMFDAISTASMVLIHKTGHLFPVERPDDVAYLIKIWDSE